MVSSTQPRVLIVGAPGPNHIESYYQRGFRQLGCPSHTFDNRADGGLREKSQLWRNIPGWVRRKNLEWGRPGTRLRRLFVTALGARKQHARHIDLLKTAQEIGPDIVFVINGLDLGPGVLQEIQAATGSKLFFFHTEDFLSSPEMHPKLFLKGLPLYDCIFTATTENLDEYPQYGARRVEFLPYGFDPIDNRPPELTDEDLREFGSELAFVGRWWFERAATLEGLTDLCQIAVWGSVWNGGWELLQESSPLRPFVKGRMVMGLDMAKVYAASRICLNNLTRTTNRHGQLMRTFEIPACGGFQLSERSEETLGFFEEGKEIECYGSLEECREKTKYYLSHETERRMIAQRGYERCQTSGYSYTERARQILSTFRSIS